MIEIRGTAVLVQNDHALEQEWIAAIIGNKGRAQACDPAASSVPLTDPKPGILKRWHVLSNSVVVLPLVRHELSFSNMLHPVRRKIGAGSRLVGASAIPRIQRRIRES